MKNKKFYSQLGTLKDTWALGARGISDFAEGSWRDSNLARWYPRLV
jgi:hypothetical protein